LPEDAPAYDKLEKVLIDGKSGSFTVKENDGVITVEFESVLSEVTISLTYKDTSYRRIEYTVAIENGAASATLKSDTVYDGSVMYIADGSSGDGLTAASPLATLEAAYTNMLTDGGTVVVCGNLTMVKYIARAHTDAITITSVYDGIDYREAGAKLYYPASSALVLGGKTIFRDITLDFALNGLISAAYNPVVFDTGITVNYDKENDEAGLYLVGGYNTGAIPQNPDYIKDSSITIRSGTVGRVFGTSRYVGNVHQSGTVNVTLEGDAHVRYLFTGATGNSATSQDAYVKIKDNAIVETLYLGGAQKDNYVLGETIVDITEIKGGDIYEFDGISLYAMVNGTDTLRYDPRTVPDGVLHLASLAWVDNILTLCDVAGEHTFGAPFASPFDENTNIHTCEMCGFTTSLEEIGGSVNGVVYVADGGFGNGASPAAPIGSYADAFDALGNDGGVIVVIRETTLPKTVKYKHGSDPEFYQEPIHEGHVLVTSLYDGVDYREAGAKLVFDGTMDYRLSGPVTFDDISFDVTDAKSENTIAARYNKLTFGDGVKMEKTFIKDGYKFNVYGGYKYFRYTDFMGVEIEDEWLRFLNHAVSTNDVTLPDSGNLNIGNTILRAEAADAFNALWAEMEALGMKLPIVSSAYQTYEWKHDFFANFLGNTRASHPDWSYERAYIYVTKSCGEPGASEHHLGVAVDMYDNTIDSENPNHDYDTTAEWDWLVNQGGAEKFGIILRCPENSYCTSVTGFINEAWHFRYIGKEHAKAYNESGYPIFEFYVGDVLGMFEKDSNVVINGGSFYNISGGSTECDGITFSGANKVTLGASVEYESASDVIEHAAGDATGDGSVNLLDVIRSIKSITDEGVYVH
ncbi:MAG: D-alanyl-D-alanine carboxypeptidase family protein, partial [Clostridia bacterium]|nr:D-alanyl-D-alanine carboxypeptidase family protein [Clostridia bacterium]